MNFVVIGTDHNMQSRDPGLEGLLSAFAKLEYMERLNTIAEEYHGKIGHSIAQRLAEEKSWRWYNLDMSTEEKQEAGILEDQRSRPKSECAIAFRVRTDDRREEAWTQKLIESGLGTTLVICGYVHFESLVSKLRERGHTVDSRVYLETVPQIKTV